MKTRVNHNFLSRKAEKEAFCLPPVVDTQTWALFWNSRANEDYISNLETEANGNGN